MTLLALPCTKALRAISYTKNCTNIILRRSLVSKQLIYNKFGDPMKVVKFRECVVPPLDSQEVLVRMLAAPVNPADINIIQGKYPLKVELPCIPGNEGVGIVEEVGQDVKQIHAGDKVIITKPVQGTWRDIAAFHKNALKVVPNNMGLVEAATLTVNPCTAYRMLTDFKPVQEKGLVVIQNGANSACGQNVIQICKAWAIRTVNIVRDRPEIKKLKEYLTGLGATFVLTEEELRSTNIFKDKLIEKPSLALNCVGGKSSLEMLRHLEHSGTMVTYGGMSREPVTVPTSAYIFKNFSTVGFWMTAWYANASLEQRDKMLDDVISLMTESKVKAPTHKMVKFEQYEDAVSNALTIKGFTGCKYILDFRKNILLPSLPTVPGDEGVGDVVEIGSKVCSIRPGDRVILTNRMLGTWRYYGIYHERALQKISKKVPLPEAAMLSNAPCIAYRLLADFAMLNPGDTVLQNAANSAIGQCIVQLCYVWGYKSMNIVSNHCGFDAVKSYLMNIGATAVCTLEEAEALTRFDTSLARPKLALNCLGGRYEDVLLKLVERNGTVVYYGGAFDFPMEKQFCRCDCRFCKFHYGDWSGKIDPVTKCDMYNKVVELMVVGKLRAPLYTAVELKDYVCALANTEYSDASSTRNYLFDFTLT